MRSALALFPVFNKVERSGRRSIIMSRKVEKLNSNVDMRINVGNELF